MQDGEAIGEGKLASWHGGAAVGIPGTEFGFSGSKPVFPARVWWELFTLEMNLENRGLKLSVGDPAQGGAFGG